MQLSVLMTEIRTMTFRTKLFIIVGVLSLAAVDRSTFAQSPSFGRPGTPTTSPYLNLLQNGNRRSLGFNYYRSFRPEKEFRRNYRQLGSELSGVRRSIEGSLPSERKATQLLGTTGHPTSFHNTAQYFPTYGRLR